MQTKSILDAAEFYELLLKHLIRDNPSLQRAKELGMVPDDFMATRDAGNIIYRELAAIALDVGTAPIDLQLLKLKLKEKLESGAMPEQFITKAGDLIAWIYNTEVVPDYFVEHMKSFIKRRREERIKLEHYEDTDRLIADLNKLAIKMDVSELHNKVEIVNPFSQLIVPDALNLIPTGFRKIDACLHGMSYGDFGLLLGFTGSGKTATATYMSEAEALLGYNAAVISAEDTMQNMVFRYYARRYRLDYSQIRKGSANLELTQMWRDDVTVSRTLLEKHLKIFPVKGMTPISNSQVKSMLQEEFDKTGWAPDVVYMDQMQFMKMNHEPKKDMPTWEIQQQVAVECDEFSHDKIGDKPFVYWVLHQLKGNVKLRLNREDIQGFKGIDQKADTVMVIGRDGPKGNDFLFQSLKSRHSPPFEIPYKGELEYMNFTDIEMNIAPTVTQQQGTLPLTSLLAKK